MPSQAERRQAFEDALFEASPRVIARAQGFCEKCRIHPVEHIHHKIGRGPTRGRDPNALEYLLGVCHACHRQIHDHPDLSYEAGWMIRRNSL